MEAERVIRYYRFAGISYRLEGRPEELDPDDGVLGAFRTDPEDGAHTIELEIVRSLPLPEGTCVHVGGHRRVFRRGEAQITCLGDVDVSAEHAYLQITREGNRSVVQVLRSAVPDRIKPRLILRIMEAEHFVVRNGGFILHSSFICHRGRAILFTAPSGTGKSTQAGLWARFRGAEQINGDRTAVMADGTGIRACGIPFCGTSGIARNEEYPLAAVVCLSQAPVSTVTRLTGLRAFRRIWEGCSVNLWDRKDVEMCSETVMHVISHVPVYHLACTQGEDAVQVLEKAMYEGSV